MGNITKNIVDPAPSGHSALVAGSQAPRIRECDEEWIASVAKAPRGRRGKG